MRAGMFFEQNKTNMNEKIGFFGNILILHYAFRLIIP